MLKKQFKMITVGLALLAFAATQVNAADSRVTLPNGKKIFVSGMNLAWINFANDVGDVPLQTAQFDAAMKAISDSGANTMRIWLSTNGMHDPKYGSDGLVSGPASKTVENIKSMLILAKKNNLVLVLTLLTHNLVDLSNVTDNTILNNNKKLLNTDDGLNAYINNYLKPLVKEIGNDPNLLCWEVFNEPEGMVNGWSSPANTISKERVQKAVNWIAAAIHETDSHVLVSNGAASMDSKDWYRDDALITAGGKANGTLNFYMVHYYGWNGVNSSPFTKACSYWNMDKPLVIGEYASSDWKPGIDNMRIYDSAKVDTLMTYLDKTGYAGGLGWPFKQDGGSSWMKGFPTFGHSMMEAYRADSGSIKLTGTSNGTFLVAASAGMGGTVKSSVKGRVDSLKADTLTATASAGYSFTGWSGDTTATGAVLIIPHVVKDWSIRANFTVDAGTNLIKGGDFSSGTDWSFWVSKEKGNDAIVSFTNGQADIAITKTDTSNYNIQLSQGGIPLVAGVTYTISLDAWSSAERPMHVGLSTAATFHYQGGEDISLTSTKSSYTIDITPDLSTDVGIIQFNAGKSTLPVHIDNVQMVKASSSKVTNNHFYKSESVSFNRVGDRIFWSTSSKQAKVMLLNINGRIIQPVTNSNPIQLTNYPNGLYLFVVYNNAQKQVFQIMK